MDPANYREGRRVAIYGARGFARELHQLLKDLAASGTPTECVSFLVDAGFCESATVHDLPVFEDMAFLGHESDVAVVIGIGATAPRRRIAIEIERRFGPRFVTLVHPRAWVGDNVAMNTGSVVCAGALATTDISLGAHVQLHVGCKIGHDAVIQDFVTIAPGATVSGRVSIEEGVFVGAGAVILPDIKIGKWSTIGAGAAVTKDVPDEVTVAGVPARIISRQDAGWHLSR